MTATNSSTKASSKKKRNPVVQAVLQPEVHEQFLKRCELEKRSESAMGAILIAQGLCSETTSSNTNAA